VAGLGAVYIGGETVGNLGGVQAGNGDAFLSKFDLAGQLLWTRQSGTAVSDHIRAVTTSPDGYVYAGGTTEGSFAATNAGETDVFLSKYDAAGSTLWSRQIGSSGDDAIHAIVVDSGGNA
jgi:outer membrane protein assembly factor BamB